MKLVIDTNILVSALLTPFQAPARVLDLAVGGEVIVCWDDRILAEYRAVLARPKFGFDRRAVDDLMTYLETAGMAIVAPPLAANLPDPDDIAFVEVSAAAQALWVTGNVRHFPREQCAGVAVMTPGEFLVRWQQEAE